MGFRLSSRLVLLTGVLLSNCAIGLGEQGALQIIVLVHDSARVSPEVLAEAEGEAERIFHAAGIEISWVRCVAGSEERCQVQPRLTFVVHILRSGKTSSDSVFGEAFLGEDGVGKYCDIFLERIQQAAQGIDLSTRLLGAVIAHELGHLLLGSRSHSTWGIMAAAWRHEELCRIGMGTLLFDDRQARLMRSRIGAVNVVRTRYSTRNDY